MKKNKTMRLASGLLVAVLLTTCAISGTFAKYVSDVAASDSARVAKWSIKVEGEEIGAEEPTIIFNLFDYTDANVDVNGKDDNAQVIAPGTTGSFKIDIVNESEVNAKYTIKFEETNNGNIPLQYSVDGTTWKDSINELAMEQLTDQAIAMNNGTDARTIYWKWVFDNTTGTVHDGQTDVTDTALGHDAAYGNAATVTIKATITVTQVD